MSDRLAELLAAIKPRPWIEQLHPAQRAVALSPARWKAITTSRRSGKTVLDCALAADSMAVSGYDEYTLYLARNRGVAKELFWPKIRGLVKAHGLPWHVNESELRITTQAGGSLLVKGAEGGDPEEEREKLRGLKLRRVLCDEPATYAATLRKLLRDVIEPGLGDLRGDCIVNGTPGIVCSGAWHEISTGVLPPGDRRPKSSLEKWSRWHWDLRANPFFNESERYLQEVMAENGWTEDDPTFQREYLGRWVVDVTAQVYRYVAGRNTVTDVPGYDKHSWVHSIGVDFGMVDECAWAVLASPPHGRDIYVIRSEARVGLRPEQAAQFTHELVTEYKPHRLVGDAGGLGKPYVEEYNHRFDAGIRMVPAEKTEKRAHIELINGDFGAPRLFLLMPQCEDLSSQLENLPWSNESREAEHAGYKNHRCFVAGTLVHTADGDRPIESVSVGDMVWTRNGLRRVLAAECSGLEETWRLQTTHGRQLVGTGNHPIFSEGKFLSMDSLIYGDRLVTWQESKPQSSTVASTADIKTQRTGQTEFTTSVCAGRSEGLDTCIEMCGNTTSEPFRLGITSTTWTRTQATTIQQTWRAFLRLFTQLATRAMNGLLDVVRRCCHAQSPRLAPGMPHQKAWLGIERTASVLGQQEKSQPRFASGAIESSCPRMLKHGCAAENATLLLGDRRESTTSTDRAGSAVEHLGRAGTQRPRLAHDRVESTSRTGTRAIVYNLTVDDAHEYFANGILVSNCDALLYSWRDHTAYMHGPADERTDKLPGESGYESYLEQLEVERFNESRNGWMHR